MEKTGRPPTTREPPWGTSRVLSSSRIELVTFHNPRQDMDARGGGGTTDEVALIPDDDIPVSNKDTIPGAIAFTQLGCIARIYSAPGANLHRWH